jgi:DNA-directed RNA polymerase specialized sigma subunit
MSKTTTYKDIDESIKPLIESYNKIIPKLAAELMPVIAVVKKHFKFTDDDDALYFVYFKSLLKCLQYHDPSKSDKFAAYLTRKMKWQVLDELRKDKKRDELFSQELDSDQLGKWIHGVEDEFKTVITEGQDEITDYEMIDIVENMKKNRKKLKSDEADNNQIKMW